MVTEAEGTYARYFGYLNSHVRLELVAGRVRLLGFEDSAIPEADTEHALLDRIDAYLTGTVRDDFDNVPVSLELSDRHVAILEAVRAIPYGESRSVAELLQGAEGFDPDSDEDHNLVREALDANPVPVFVPDHRIRDGPSGAPPPIEQRLRSLERIVT